MSLSPIDVAQQTFRRSFGGANVAEVEAFLHTVAQAMTDLVRQNAELKAQLAVQQQKAQGLEGRENDVKEALVLAQRAVEEVRGQAAQKAKLTLELAEVEAQKIVAEAQERKTSLTGQVRELTRQRTRFVEELRGLVHTHARLLEMHTGEPVHVGEHATGIAAGNDVFEVLQAPLPPAVAQGAGRRTARVGRAAARSTLAPHE